MNEDNSEIIKSILELINRPMHSAKLQNAKAWDSLELTKEQLRLLSFIFFEEESSPGAIAKHFGVSKANVTSVIEKMVKKGFLNRQENPHDRRGYIITTTESGKEQIRKLREMHSTNITKMLKLMDTEDLEALAKGLKGFIKAMEERSDKCT